MTYILLIVDPQYDFIDGPLSVNTAEDKMNALALALQDREIDPDIVFITMDCHPKKHCSFKEYGGQWPSHCVNGSLGFMIYKPLAQEITEFEFCILTKGTSFEKEEYSVLQNESSGFKFREYLWDNPDCIIEIVGIAGDYCVLETVKDLVKLGYKDNLLINTEYIASIDNGLALSNYIEENKLKWL